MEIRIERDDGGEVMIPARRYWGVGTERRRARSVLGLEPIPGEILRAFGILKKAAARVNYTLRPDEFDEKQCAAVFAAADEMISGKLARDFPLPAWQPGAGRHTDDNVNEVLVRRGNEMADEEVLRAEDAALSLSPESAFPAALRIAAALAVLDAVLPAAEDLARRAEDGELARCCASLDEAAAGLLRLDPGALPDVPEGFDEAVAAGIAKLTGRAFTASAHAVPERLDELVRAHEAMKALADALEPLAERLRPILPEAAGEEARERAALSAVGLLGNDAALRAAASRSAVERRALLPLCACAFLQSARLLGDTAERLGDLLPGERTEEAGK